MNTHGAHPAGTRRPPNTANVIPILKNGTEQQRMNRSKTKGTAWETAIVRHLETRGYPHAERRALSGANDRGDIAGMPCVVVEAKAARTMTLGPWLKELDQEIVNDGADTGALWIKRVGKASAADGVIVMRPADWLALLKTAGY